MSIRMNSGRSCGDGSMVNDRSTMRVMTPASVSRSHRDGADGHDLVADVARVDLRIRVLLPRADRRRQLDDLLAALVAARHEAVEHVLCVLAGGDLLRQHDAVLDGLGGAL